jgi:hypothetical protein
MPTHHHRLAAWCRSRAAPGRGRPGRLRHSSVLSGWSMPGAATGVAMIIPERIETGRESNLERPATNRLRLGLRAEPVHEDRHVAFEQRG